MISIVDSKALAATVKEELGKKIAACRGEMSLRQLALQVGIAPSNMKYIEDGVNAPTAEVYGKLIAILKPSAEERQAMDVLYMSLRATPPPDICEWILNNPEVIASIRRIRGRNLMAHQMELVDTLFDSIDKENERFGMYN